jgi:hypothetical protein
VSFDASAEQSTSQMIGEGGHTLGEARLSLPTPAADGRNERETRITDKLTVQVASGQMVVVAAAEGSAALEDGDVVVEVEVEVESTVGTGEAAQW